MSSLKTPQNGEALECPVCGKSFKASDDTRFIMNGGWTCSWTCFINEHKKQMQPKWDKQKEEKQLIEVGERKPRGRKRMTADDKVDSAYNRIKAEAIKNKSKPKITEDIIEENTDESLDIDNAAKIAEAVFAKTELI